MDHWSTREKPRSYSQGLIRLPPAYTVDSTQTSDRPPQTWGAPPSEYVTVGYRPSYGFLTNDVQGI
jgi:hypothetical protein